MKGQRAHTRATRMAATFLAKQNGADAAATAFGIDPRTVRSWLQTVEIPDDQWTAIRDVLLARGAEMAALGKTAGLPAVLTGAGISDRNVRYGQLIARREAGRAGETCDCVLPPAWVPELHPKAGTPEHAAAVWAIAAAKMSEPRRHFMDSLRPLLARYIDHMDGDGGLDIPEAREATAAALAGVPADGVGGLQAWIEGLDDETLAARQALVDAAHTAYRDAIQGELQRRAYDEATAAAEYDARKAVEGLDPDNQRQLRDWALDKLGETDSAPVSAQEPIEPPAPTPEPTPLPTDRVQRPRPVPMVMDVGREDHDRGWSEYERRDNW